MPFGMAGLDFCVRNPYRNRGEKTFFAEGAYWKKFMHPDACCTEQIQNTNHPFGAVRVYV